MKTKWPCVIGQQLWGHVSNVPAGIPARWKRAPQTLLHNHALRFSRRLLFVASVLALTATIALLDLDRSPMAGAERGVAAEPLPAATGTVPAAEPKESEAGKLVRRALAWLIKMIDSEDWKKEIKQAKSGGDANELALQYLAPILTAWALETNPQLHEFDSVRRRFRDSADRLAGKDPSGAFRNWCQGFAGLYVYERSLRDGKPHPALDGIARGFAKRRNKENAWGHGGAENIFLNYSPTLIPTTTMALFALGAAQREKTPFTKEKDYKQTVDDALEVLCKAQQHSSGGMPYGVTPPFTQDPEAGRTAGMLLALAALEQTDTELFQRAASYVLDKMETIPDGHGSRPFHVAMGALGCYLLGDEAWEKYQHTMAKFRATQKGDGSFVNTDGVRSEPEKGQTLAERAYATALYAISFSTDRMEVARRLRLRTSFTLKKAALEKRRRLAKLYPRMEQATFEVVEAVEKLGGKVRLEHEGQTITAVDFRNTPAMDKDLKKLKDLKDLRQLNLARTPVTDAGLKEIRGLKELTRLDLSCTPVTNAGLRELKELKKLQRLGLAHTKVTDAGVADLKEALPELEIVR